MHFEERHINIVQALQKAEEATCNDLAQRLGLQTSQVMSSLKPLISCGVVKVEEDDGKTLYYPSPSADKELVETYAESIADILIDIMEMDRELDQDGIKFLFSIAASQVDIGEAPDDDDNGE